MAKSQPRVDPDLEDLAEHHGHDDLYRIIDTKATALLIRLDDFDAVAQTPLQRIITLASIAGIPVRPATRSMSAEGRAAMYVPASALGKGYIVYDATLPESRTIFSIGHEITHSFIPSSSAGVRFRSSVVSSSRSGRQLEMLCEFGAALLTMPADRFRAAIERHGFCLTFVPLIQKEFGTSFEATLYRVAQLTPFAAALKLKHRYSKKELNTAPASGHLFPMPDTDIAEPKYRVQSFYRGPDFPGKAPFNKSFPETSSVARAATTTSVQSGRESLFLIGGRSVSVTIQAVRAPYQPAGSDPLHPDVLALVRAVRD